jgi:hypothetical protein
VRDLLVEDIADGERDNDAAGLLEEAGDLGSASPV